MSQKTKPSRRQSREAASEYIHNLTGQPFPNSKKVYVEGSQPGVRVGMREIALSDTFVGGSEEDPIYEKMTLFVFMTPQGHTPIQILSSMCAKAFLNSARLGLQSVMTPSY